MIIVGYNYIGGDIDASNFLLGDGVTEIYRIADDDELELLGSFSSLFSSPFRFMNFFY